MKMVSNVRSSSGHTVSCMGAIGVKWINQARATVLQNPPQSLPSHRNGDRRERSEQGTLDLEIG